jgi:hypothetical protein
MSSRSLRVAVAALTAATALPLLAPPASARVGSADTATRSVTERGVAFLRSAQQVDGSFDAGFTFDGVTYPASDFATSESVLAIAEQAQTGTVWNTAQALQAVRSATNATGANPLAFVDAEATPSMSAGKAAKFAYLVAAPLGLDARRFDPAGDGGAVDLIARIDAGRLANGAYAAGAINATNFAVLAKAALGLPVDADTVTYLRGAQQPNGGWSFSGSPTGTGVENDTTARTIQALIAAGVPANDTAVRRGVAFLASQQAADGGFGSTDGSVDRVASSALVSIALEAAGWSPATACWRDTVLPARRGEPYVAPTTFMVGQQLADGSFTSPFGAEYTTAQAVQGLLRGWQPTAAAPSQCPARGYRVVTADGGVFSLGTATFAGSASGNAGSSVVAAMSTPDGGGYWLVAADGGVFSYGNAVFSGSAAGLRLASPIVGAAATPTGRGYWLVAADGGVFSYGDARFHGSAASLRLNRPIVGMAASPTGNGYWLFASDGGVFSYGEARFAGSPAALPLVAPVVGGAPSPTGRGYWLVAADGGVFAYGDATFVGSAAGVSRSTVVALAPTPAGDGYHLLARDGGVFAYGTAPFVGSAVPFGLRANAVALA